MAGSPAISPARSTRSEHSDPPNSSSERTPLLSRHSDDNVPSYTEQGQNGVNSPAARSLRSGISEDDGSHKRGSRWPTIAALSILCVLFVVILGVGFAAPAAIEEYAKEAIVLEPKTLSVDSFTETGVKVRIQGAFTLDASRVHRSAVRQVGKVGTYIAKEIETDESELRVYLPGYNNLILGTARIPPIRINIRNGNTNDLDILTEVYPGHVDGIRRVATDWVDGNLVQLELKGVAKVTLKSGLLRLGSQTITQSMIFEDNELPDIPVFDITKLNFHEVETPQVDNAMVAEALISVHNDYPVQLDVPPLSFDVLIPNCFPNQHYLLLASAMTQGIKVKPREPVDVSVSALIKQFPDAVTSVCPDSNSSPLDALLGSYIQGKDTIVYIRGAKGSPNATPEWVAEFLQSVTVPVPFPGHSFDNLVRNFTLADVHFSLPDPQANPDEPGAQPRISTIVKALVALPQEMNFNLNVRQVRADADIFYHGKKLGELDLHEWQDANATRVDDERAGSSLLVQSVVEEAPLHITDDKVFQDVVQCLVFGQHGITLGVKAKIDVETNTTLGDFIVREIPAEGEVFVKPIAGSDGISGLNPTVGNLKILRTTETTVTLQARVNMTNPTEYSAYVPYINVNIINNGTVLGHVTATNVKVKPGNNTNLLVEALWDPPGGGGEKGIRVGRDLISQYISGFNTTLTFKTHEESIPSQPTLGKALSNLEITIPTPHLSKPKVPGSGDDRDDDEDEQGFIKDATMHLLSSTAAFTLLSPLPDTSLYITSISAIALYNHTEPVGNIDYDLPFKVPPGASTTPRLPVDWSLEGAGYDAVRDALGGTLKLDAKADAGVRIGKWQEHIWFVGNGIGAHVRL